jgi:hypothetical protein
MDEPLSEVESDSESAESGFGTDSDSNWVLEEVTNLQVVQHVLININKFFALFRFWLHLRQDRKRSIRPSELRLWDGRSWGLWAGGVSCWRFEKCVWVLIWYSGISSPGAVNSL